jgi:acyl-CoA synthetase (AMP-forming)/AMP-acid ligase II
MNPARLSDSAAAEVDVSAEPGAEDRTAPAEAPCNVADRLARIAREMPAAIAIACSGRGDVAGGRSYATCTFRELDEHATAVARGLTAMGVAPGDRLVLLVRPGIEFVKLVFGMLRSGATTVLVDPGMPRNHLIDCLAESRPDGFVAASVAHALRCLYRRRLAPGKFQVTVGRRWFWGGVKFEQLVQHGLKLDCQLPATSAGDPAAIIFTSGSTGPPKGVLYTHQMFETQVSQIDAEYGFHRGGVDLACFPLFGLFNSALGVTTVFPRMDFSRPASADPRELLRTAHDWKVTQSFASPTVWDRLSRYCELNGERVVSLQSVFSCGAPVPADVLQRTLAAVSVDAHMHTPYGATESLPVATIEAREVLQETAGLTARGAGVCVGRRFDSIHWRVIRICDEPLATWAECEELPPGEIGELIVSGPQVSPQYVACAQALRGPGKRSPTSGSGARDENPPLGSAVRPPNVLANEASKIIEGERIWHRMGDVGYLDEQGRFWYCGRKSHRVMTTSGVRYSIPVEAIVNTHPAVRRSALVGVGDSNPQRAVVVVELEKHVADHDQVLSELRDLATEHELLRVVSQWLVHPSLPVDVRHNAKINREALAIWAGAT